MGILLRFVGWCCGGFNLARYDLGLLFFYMTSLTNSSNLLQILLHQFLLKLSLFLYLLYCFSICKQVLLIVWCLAIPPNLDFFVLWPFLLNIVFLDLSYRRWITWTICISRRTFFFCVTSRARSWWHRGLLLLLLTFLSSLYLVWAAAIHILKFLFYII